MRVLFLAAALPDLAATAESRQVQTLRYLAREHDVTLLAPARGSDDRARRFALETLCRKVEVVEQSPALVARLAGAGEPAGRVARGRELRLAARRLIEAERIGLVHVDQPSMTACVPAAWQGPLVLDERGATWRNVQFRAERTGNPARRWLLRRAARARRESEAATCRRATVTLAASERERQGIEQAIGTPWAVHVVPIGLDVARWDTDWQERERDPRRLLTAGGLNTRAGRAGVRWFLREVWPLARRERPDAEYAVAGLRAADHARLADQPGVHVYEQADDAATWADAGIFVAPWRSGGPRRELLQALAAGIPVVTTPTACDGLAIVHGEHALLAETAEEFAAALARLAAEPRLARLLALRGHRLALDHYDMPVAQAALTAAYEHVLTGAVRCVLCS